VVAALVAEGVSASAVWPPRAAARPTRIESWTKPLRAVRRLMFVIFRVASFKTFSVA
jgi:hypothetical protein